ncbi:MAG: tRNA lysidine(34) synthetase TilS [Algoriphagus sp.]|nr:tRNA lysidine(34) synthetase TilS [Algoriphagus sp.]
MYDAFISHINQRKLFEPGKRYLLACSGGLDSMALAHLLHAAGISLELAHVNFGLRGEESDGDEEFVKKWGLEQGFRVHVHLAKTQEWVEKNGVSIQMAAREIRYQFFEEIRSQHNLAGIILAHHQDDQLETIFLNLSRGTGIEGLYGMSERRGELIRPLLPFSRAQLEDYAEEVQLPWREDRSNAAVDYKRNKLRHQGLPALYSLEPDMRQNLLQSFARLKDTGKAFSGLVEQWKAAHVREQQDMQILPYQSIRTMQGAASLLYYWLRPYGFNSDQAQALAASLTEIQSGTIFRSSSFEVCLDREELFLYPISIPFSGVELSYGTPTFELPDGRYAVDYGTKLASIDRNPEHALLDLDCLEFPLHLRSWQEGDRFIPLGMNSEKKLSDFLIDNKIPIPLKKEVKVLVSGNKIAWVVGMRIADWAKVSPATQKYMHIQKH